MIEEDASGWGDEFGQDEGWWEAVIDDVERQINTVPSDLPKQQSKPEMAVHRTPRAGLREQKNARRKTTVNDWAYAQILHTEDAIIDLEVVGYNQGGVLVSGDRLRGFVPASHLVDVPTSMIGNRRQHFRPYMGRKIAVKIIELSAEKERIVFSERSALAGEGKRKNLLSSIKAGDIVSGIVTNITDFGVFIDLGGLEGLIHVSELSWGRVQHPAEILRMEDPVDALVLHISEEEGKIALSIKQLQKNPWLTVQELYQEGDVISAEITAVVDFGIFARLDEGVEGLIHISSLNLSELDQLYELYQPGQTVLVRIVAIDCDKRRLSLALLDMID